MSQGFSRLLISFHTWGLRRRVLLLLYSHIRFLYLLGGPVLGDPDKISPLSRANFADTQPGLLQHLHVFEGLSGAGLLAELLQGNGRVELAPELDVDDAPLGIGWLGGRVVVGSLGVMCRHCSGM